MLQRKMNSGLFSDIWTVWRNYGNKNQKQYFKERSVLYKIFHLIINLRLNIILLITALISFWMD